MLARVQKWGNSLALRLPKSLADEAAVGLDTPVNIIVRDHKILIEPVREKKSYDLDELLLGINQENLQKEVDSGSLFGKEIW